MVDKINAFGVLLLLVVIGVMIEVEDGDDDNTESIYRIKVAPVPFFHVVHSGSTMKSSAGLSTSYVTVLFSFPSIPTYFKISVMVWVVVLVDNDDNVVVVDGVDVGKYWGIKC